MVIKVDEIPCPPPKPTLYIMQMHKETTHQFQLYINFNHLTSHKKEMAKPHSL
jgi:hypothetical protein